MNESIDFLGKAAFLSTMHVNSGYWQIKVEELNRERNFIQILF